MSLSITKSKGFVMKKTGLSLLLLALIAGLPGCGGSKKDKAMTKGQQMAQADADEMAVAANLSDDELADFFAGMEEFAALSDEELERVADEFAWVDADDLEPVYFEFAKTDVDEGQVEKLAYDVERAKQLLEDVRAEDADAKLVVEGHACASAGSAERNLAYSKKRAEVVAEALVNAGVDRDALRVVGRGNEMLVVEDGDKEQQWPNRRVELHVLRA